MAVVALALGILGLVIFWWAGPVAGSAWAGAASFSQATLVTWPVWVLGIGLGVVPALIAVGLGIAALKKEPKKGVALAGLILGVISAIGGLITTVMLVFSFNVAGKTIDDAADELNQQMQQPVEQQGLKQLMDQSAKPSDE